MLIDGVYDVTIIIEGVELFSCGSAFNIVCKIEESVCDNIPICKLVFGSSKEFIDKLPIVDGTRIIIKIHSDQLNINEQLCFRTVRTSFVPSGDYVMYSISGIIDFYELFRDPIKYSMNNNSSEIFKKIVQDNQITGIIHQTQDKQLWSPTESNLYQWMSYIASHAWSTPQSGFYWFMNRRRNLYFIDIDKLIHESKNIICFHYGNTTYDDIQQNKIRYGNFSVDISHGDENLFNRGYDGENSHFDLLSYATKTENAKKVRATSEIVNINKELSHGLGKNILQFDIGNHHKNYFLSEAQNRRVLSTYSTYIKLSCDFFRPLNLSQVCTIDASSPNSSATKLNTMKIKYIISKIVTNISSSKVNMNVELCSQGYNGNSTESY